MASNSRYAIKPNQTYDWFLIELLLEYSNTWKYLTLTSVYQSYLPIAQNTPTASLQRGKTSQMRVLDMILNNLIVRLQ